MSTAVTPEPTAPAATNPAAPTTEPTNTTTAPPTDPGAVVVPDPAKPAAPATYTLTLPENPVLDAAAIERTAAFARERGLSQDAAQAALELANTEAATQRDAFLKAHEPGGAEWDKQVQAWTAQTLADPLLGTTPDDRTAAIEKGKGVLRAFGQQFPDRAEDVKTFLEVTQLGSHPAMAHFLAWVGKGWSEGRFISPGASQSPTEVRTADLLYASTTPKS